VPVKDHAGVTILEKDEFIKGNTTVEGLAKLNASFEMMGQMGFDAVALQKYPEAQKLITFIMQVTHQVSSMVLRWCYWLLKKQSKNKV
jgi:acetyl-CoA acetyltransferase